MSFVFSSVFLLFISSLFLSFFKNIDESLLNPVEQINEEIDNNNVYRVERAVHVNDEGTYDYSTKIYYPQTLQLTMVSSSSRRASSILPMMAPGEELTILVDMNVVPDSTHDAFVGLKGYMAKYSRRDWECDMDRYLDRKSATLALWTTENAKTVADIIAGHDSVVTSYEAFNKKHGYSELESKHVFDYELRYFALVARSQDSLFRSKEFLDYIMRTRPACFF